MYWTVLDKVVYCPYIGRYIEGKMARTKGAKNKQKVPPTLQLSEQERVELLAKILVEIIDEERRKGMLCKTP